ncbi:hypothetical protein HGG75_24915 [Ochrobactrum pseudogrignonense]|nr:hypothetical protein [Brucella pseudogrignonensis]
MSATNNYSGTTTVQAGSLIVNGSIAASSLTTVQPVPPWVAAAA